MRGTRTLYRIVLGTALCLATAALGCNKSSGAPSSTAATATSEETAPRASRPSRGEISCHIHSCAPPRYCNQDKGVCEHLACTDSRDCPYGYKCDYSKNVCK